MLLCGPLSAVPEPPAPTAAGVLETVVCMTPLVPALVVGLLPEKGATVTEGEEEPLLPHAPAATNAVNAATGGPQMRRR
jgi:hypothetical protein